MTLVFVDSIPAIKTKRHNKLQKLIKDFAESDRKFAKIKFEEGEYANIMSLYSTMYKACERSKRPIKPCLRKKEGAVYLIKI